MSGHSHSKTIKHAKELTDKKRGQMFSKMAGVISVAVKEGGPNPETNTKLKVAIEQAKSVNMPSENIERAIKRGKGALAGEKLEEFSFEAYGPGGIALLIEGITDNKNRTLGEIKQILNQNNGKLVESGVRWLFDKKGVITINNEGQTINKEELELKAIEAGAEDIFWYAAPEGSEPRQGRENYLDVYAKPEELESVKKNLEEKGIKIKSASIGWVAKEDVEVSGKDKESCGKLFESLDENDAVQEIYSNLKE